MEKTLDAWGIAQPTDVPSYYYKWSTRAELGREELEKTRHDILKDDVIMEVDIEGITDPYCMLTKARAIPDTLGMDDFHV